MMKNLYLNQIEDLKKKFIHLYIIIMCSMLIFYIILFQFFIYNPTIVLYLTAGLCILSYTYILVKGKYSADHILHGYMIVAPLYNFYIMLTFWENSVGTFVMLFPLPLAAYIFFSIKETIAYSLYLIINVFLCFLFHEYSGFQFAKYTRDEVAISDAIVFLINLIIIILMLIYNNKINKLRILLDVNTKKSVDNKVKNDQASALSKTVENIYVHDETAEKLFEELENIMEKEKIFKNTNLNISILSTSLSVNYNYLSKIIRYKGYQNFNSYLNVHRINYVKKLIGESDLQKVTLMYIYTEAGFSNQATFNRVFKQIEGITPSEYISNMGEREIFIKT